MSDADQFLPMVYDELRRLAAAKLANERPGHTLDATALVHEAYLKLMHAPSPPVATGGPATRNQFLRAAAVAMQRILVDHARKKRAEKRGGEGHRFEVSEADRVHIPDPDTVIAVNEALEKLTTEDADAAEVARLRLFTGLSIEQTAEALGVSRATAFRDWSYARAWLTAALSG
jgi:RNA polymerase sigma factor (TIGR02999 family)